MSNVGIPFHTSVIDQTGRMTQPWAAYFTQLQIRLGGISPKTANSVGDGSIFDTGPTTIYQNSLANRHTNQVKQDLYFALDTGDIYTINAVGNWQLQSGALTGDVTKPLGSNTVIFELTGDITKPSGSNIVSFELTGDITKPSGSNIVSFELTGDVTKPSGSNTTTLPDINSNAGTYSYSSVTANAKGQITSISSGIHPLNYTFLLMGA